MSKARPMILKLGSIISGYDFRLGVSEYGFGSYSAYRRGVSGYAKYLKSCLNDTLDAGHRDMRPNLCVTGLRPRMAGRVPLRPLIMEI